MFNREKDLFRQRLRNSSLKLFLSICIDYFFTALSILPPQLHQHHTPFIPLPIVSRKYKSFQRTYPKSTPIPIMPFMILLPLQPNPSYIIEQLDPKRPGKKISTE